MSSNTNKTELEAKLAELEAKLEENETQRLEDEAKYKEQLAEKDAELAKAKESAEAAKSQTIVKPAPAVEKMVQIKIPLTREETGDVFVSVNDRQWLIKRGEYVEVPECVAEVLRHQENALRRAIEFIAANEQKLPQ